MDRMFGTHRSLPDEPAEEAAKEPG
jgi:hypothetical protein